MAAASTFAAIALALALPATSLADSEATTEPASSITSTSAVLNGTADPSSPDSAYSFQYGTTTDYGQNTPVRPIGAGPQSVSESVTGLQPATTYHFRLVVEDNSYSSTAHTGDDLTFTTPALNAIATTGSATSITNHAATLNGVVNTTNSDSAWAFQYGTSNAYGSVTPVHTVGAGVTAVSARITGLDPSTKYHFRLVVAQGSYQPVYSTGNDRTFTTFSQPFGTLKLRHTKLRIRGGKVTVPLRCKGVSGAPCRGRLKITAVTAKGRTVRCISMHYSAKAPKKFKLRRRVRGRCLRLVSHAKGHRIGASLSATYSANQSRLQRSVVLFQ